MAGTVDVDPPFEPERYELQEGPAYRFEVDRREFLASFGAGLFVWLGAGDLGAQQREGGREEDAPQDIAAWLHVAEDGTVTAYTGKVEFGQDIRTSLAQAVAEELKVSLGSVRLVMGDTALTPFDMGTFGSRTTPVMAPQLRRMAAAAREAILDLAAERWSVPRETLRVADGRIGESGGRSATFGELAGGRKLVRKAADVTVTPPSAWTIAGQSVPKVNARELVTGAHVYTSDLTRPGMWHGRVLRPPALGATLRALEETGAKAAGAVVVRDGTFAGVAAATAVGARRALQELRAEWTPGPALPAPADLFAHLKRTPPEPTERGGRITGAHEAGNLAEGLAGAAHRLQQSYTVAYIAHAPLEPRAALAEWQDGKLTVWTGTQRPFGVRRELAEAFRLREEDVRVIVPDTGSGYGGKHSGETAIEAARLARAAGRPVRLVWTREEEFAWAYFRPAGLIEVASGAAADGRLTAWEFHNYNAGGSAIRTPYDVPHQKIAFHPARSPLRQGSYRGLAATANHFAREVHMDEVAQAARLDPLELRRRNLKDERVRAVLDAAAERFGWGRPKGAPNRGFGLAAGTEKGSYVACCAEVAVERASGVVRVLRLVTAFECGAIVNPAHLTSQVEGAVVQGLGGALFEAVRFEGGEIVTDRFSRYRVPRFSDVPALEVVLLDRKDLPSAGAGETPIVTVAPAIANAIFDAAGVRLRAMPLVPGGRLPATS